VQRREAGAYCNGGVSWLSVAARWPLVRAAWRRLARVLGRGECGRRGSLYRHVWHGRGAKDRNESEILAEIALRGAPCLFWSVWEG
jgi:hypothetical protein